jgi:hypothetical protein
MLARIGRGAQPNEVLTVRIHRLPATIVAVVLACGALAATAFAFSSGGAQVQMINADSTTGVITTSTAWVDLAGSGVHVTVPSGTQRLINARFTAESMCHGPNSGWCSVRIVYANAATGGLIGELNPASAINYAFDSDTAGTTNDVYEGNAMERSIRLGAGSYIVKVQYAVTSNTIQFSLDDWHLAVEVSA